MKHHNKSQVFLLWCLQLGAELECQGGQGPHCYLGQRGDPGAAPQWARRMCTSGLLSRCENGVPTRMCCSAALCTCLLFAITSSLRSPQSSLGWRYRDRLAMGCHQCAGCLHNSCPEHRTFVQFSTRWDSSWLNNTALLADLNACMHPDSVQ